MMAEIVDLLGLFFKRRRATPDAINRFYKSAEWKRACYEICAAIRGRGAAGCNRRQRQHLEHRRRGC
ncbi:MAG: hypothetical protein JNL98_15775 [Bryobacterales bacterium]|nr:hypothetical protein [Bryobacterales bacterium]